MKFVYWLILFVIFIMLLIIYFINLLYLSGTSMFLFWKTSSISLPSGLLMIIFVSITFGVVSVLFFQSIVKSKPKDIFDEDF